MEPTLKDGEQVYVDQNYYKPHNLSRGDIIAFKLKTQETPFVKRVIALECDKLEFGEDGNIYLNGEKLEEPYLSEDYHFDPSKTKALLIPLNQTNNTVPEGTVLVLGDNRRNSFDSGDYGFVPVEYILGRAVDQAIASSLKYRYICTMPEFLSRPHSPGGPQFLYNQE